ncbi:MAG: DUF4968 domain-containing protein [Clostridium sp.]|nr:DUF4968 domain-containing protein [Clostridium sp.]
MTIPNDKEFPQFKIAESVNLQNNSVNKYTVVHNRPDEILDVERTKSGLILTLSATAKKANLSYTHETALHLLKTCDVTIDRLYLHIELWSDTIFKVMLSSKKHPENSFANIPKDARMLIAEPEKVNFEIDENDEQIIIKTAKIEIHIDKTQIKISAFDSNGKEYFAQRKNNFRTPDTCDLAVGTLDNEYQTFEALELLPDELIYGLGERFDSLVRNGRTVDFHNKDAVGTTSKRTYVNIPFCISTKGYGLFLNSGAKTNWDIATDDAASLQFSVYDNQMEYFVIQGSTPKDIIKSYCTLTGFAPLPPLWSFGLWMSRNSYISWDVAFDVADKIRKYDIPCDVIHLDTAWFKTDWDCDLKFSEERFPNPTENMAKLREMGFHTTLWQYNFIPPNADNTHYQEAVANGYLAKNESGKPYQLPEECKGSWTKDVIIDFSNPDARKWYGNKIYSLIKMGAGAIKTDFGEGIPEDAIYQHINGNHFHNLYSLVYNNTVFNASKKASGENLVWARSGTAGSQRYPIHWGGDSQCSFEALACTLRGALSIGISGIPFFSHDIGGFLGLPDDELYIRWAQLGLFSSHARCHGAGDTTHREPWAFSDEACEIFRYYDKLRYSLMPYIYEQAEQCTKTGLPMMRALYLEYPTDRNVYHIDDEYMFGDSILVAPVLTPLSKTNIRNVYLPKGLWFDFFTKEKIVSNGMWIEKTVDLKTMPLYIKEDTVLNYCNADKSLMNGYGKIVRTEMWKD